MAHADEPASTAPREIRAIRVAIATSIIGATVKLTAGFLTGSMSLISSAVDSLGDLIISVVNLGVIRMSDAPPDEEHNYGHARVEGLGAMLEGGFIFAAASFILYEAGHKIVIGEQSHDTTLGIVVMVPILAMTLGTVTYLRKVARETGSLVVKSDALHYETDVWLNLGVLVSLVLVKVTGIPLIDPILSCGIALYMMYASTKVVREGFHVVLDRSLEPEVVARVKAVLDGTTRILSYHDLKTRGGKIPHVDFHVLVRPEMTAKELHDVYLEIRDALRDAVGPSTKVLIHADPEGG